MAGLLALVATFGARADGFAQYPELWESFDPELQEHLEAALGKLGLGKAINQRELGVALVDITNPHEPRVAAVNGDEMLYAASMPKIAILLGAFVEIEEGSMQLDDATRRSLTDMVRVSSNVEATRMLNRVGKDRLIRILQSDRFRLYDPSVNGGLWVGKEYGGSPAYRRDPLHNLSHGATAMQAARFYYLLETGQLVSPRLTREMKSMLGKPGIHHKFVKGLEQARPGAVVYRKSGTWERYHADSALVESGGHKFIAVAIAENPAGGDWLAKMIVPMHDLVVRPQARQRLVAHR
ncbi:MAG: serine hydrolase [Gammaproteobacteria bacterium]